jgi:hypothetical protein
LVVNDSVQNSMIFCIRAWNLTWMTESEYEYPYPWYLTAWSHLMHRYINHIWSVTTLGLLASNAVTWFTVYLSIRYWLREQRLRYFLMLPIRVSEWRHTSRYSSVARGVSFVHYSLSIYLPLVLEFITVNTFPWEDCFAHLEIHGDRRFPQTDDFR